MTETIGQLPASERPIDERKLISVSIAFSRHFGNYGYEAPIHLGSENPEAEHKRKHLNIAPIGPSGTDDEARLRSASLEEINALFPEHADTTRSLDSALVRADELTKEQLWAVHDYSFSTIRSVFARRILNRLNTALSLDGSESDAVAEQKLEAGGKKIKEDILGPDHPPTDLNTFSDFDVIKAVYDGRISLTTPVVSA